jgi:MerR family mercuric resistance operon transcriptional regulator
MSTELTISGLAKLAGVNVETVRYYQRRGLVITPSKPLDSSRRYPADIANRIRFIKRTQALGFSLEEIEGLLQLDSAFACVETRERMQDKFVLIEKKITDLMAMRDAMGTLATGAVGKGPLENCPLIAALGMPEASQREE